MATVKVKDSKGNTVELDAKTAERLWRNGQLELPPEALEQLRIPAGSSMRGADPTARRARRGEVLTPEEQTAFEQRQASSAANLARVNRVAEQIIPGSPMGPRPPGTPEAEANMVPDISGAEARLVTEGVLGTILPQHRMNFLRRLLGESLAAGLGSLVGESVDATQEPFETAGKTAGIAGAASGLASAVTKGRKGGSGENVDPAARAAQEHAQSLGVSLQPGQVSSSGSVGFLQGVADASLIGGPIVGAAKERVADAVQVDIARWVDNLGQAGGRQALGEVIADAAEGGRAAWLSTVDSLYRRVEAAAPTATVELSGDVLTRARELARQNAVKAPSVGKTEAEVQRLIDENAPPPPPQLFGPDGRPLPATNAPVTVPMSEARELRSWLLRLHRASEGDTDMEALERAGGELATLVDREIERGFMASNPTGVALREYRNANTFFRAGTERFDKELIAAIAKKDPEALFNYAVANKKPTQIRELRQAVVERDVPGLNPMTPGRASGLAGRQAWNHVKGRLIEDALMASGLGDTGAGGTAADLLRSGGKLNAGTFRSKLRAIGDEALAEIFDADELENLYRNIDVLARNQGPNIAKNPIMVALSLRQASEASKTGQAVMGMLIGGAGGAAGGAGGAVAAGTAFLGVPAAIAGFLSNRAVGNWLTIGNRARPGSEQAIRAAARLAALAHANGLSPLQRRQPGDSQRTTNPQPFFTSRTLGGPRRPEANR